ncbi:hypothetical protein GCM10009858_24760 [Terrabacter carboxydivorans]|uniref:Uncharacterized protein n=1 Tax=Terrabacter carboxydivorans TaxID=619730 RepID=A0ABN3LKI3_9MICO
MRTAGPFAPGWSTGYAGSVRSHEPATLPGSVGAGVVAGALGVVGALVVVVGLVGVSGSAVTVGIGAVDPGSAGPVVVVDDATAGDSAADAVRGVVPLHAESVRPRMTAVAAEVNPAPRLPPLRTPVLTCICLP